jgi:soluble lytic murein transglycosylase-like protein
MTFKFQSHIRPDDPSMILHLREAENYRKIIINAANQYRFQQSVIAALGSRESGWGLALVPPGPHGTGDFTPRKFPTRHRPEPLPPDGRGFGRGLLQIDYDYHEFARTGNWQDPEGNIFYGVKILHDFLIILERRTELTGIDLLRAALASYNAGPGRILKAIRDGRDIDHYTANRDYSADVLDRAGFFQHHNWE